jgi:hypothetical protein
VNSGDRSIESYLTEPRLELLAWFERHAPSLGELYHGALIMLHDENFPGRTHFVAHAVREIGNRLPDFIAGPIKSSQVQYVNRLDAIGKRWQRFGFGLDGSPLPSVTEEKAPPSTDVPIPRPLFLEFASLVKDHIGAREKPLDATKRLFRALSSTNQQIGDSLQPTIDQWLDVTHWFQEKVHHPGFKDASVDTTEFERRFELFERTLTALTRGFFKTTKELDEILESANS